MSGKPPVRVLIADDEPLARERLRVLLQGRTGVELVGEACDGQDAAAQVIALRPELIFLDVQMPELDGFAVLEAVLPWHIPEVVFVTAYDAYALKAFEAGATDYLLKPFDRPRFDLALSRALARVHAAGGPETLRALLAQVAAHRGTPVRIAVQVGRRIRFVEVAGIDWIEAAGNYARLWVGGTVHPVREPMRLLEQRLDPAHFLRIHRSAIVRLGAVAHVQPRSHGEYDVVLKDGTSLVCSRTFSGRLREFLRPAMPR